MLLTPILDLWLPILLAAVGIFIMSFLCWVVLPHHKPDARKLPDEIANTRTLRTLNLEPGRYVFPQDYKNTESEAVKQGPWGYLRLWPAMPAMGLALPLTFLVFLVAAAGLGYLGAATIEPGAGAGRVVQVIGTASLLTFAFAWMPGDIWWERSPKGFLANLLDSALYALAATIPFVLLWPSA